MSYRREDIKQFIEEYILDNDGVLEGKSLRESSIDSFSMTMIYVELGEEFNTFDDDYFKDLEYGVHTVDELVDEVIKHAR